MLIFGAAARVLGTVAWTALAVGLVGAAWVVHHRVATTGVPYPYSDEAAHVAKTVDLAETLARTTGTWDRIAAWCFSHDAYPNAMYASALLQGARTLDALRGTLAGFTVLHATVALIFGPRLWGRAGTLAYVALTVFSAYPLAFATGYYLDAPMTACVGAALVLLEASEGFRRPIPSILFVLVATLGLYTKWTWGAFCAIPCAVAALRALGPLPGWPARVLGALALLGTVLGAAAYVRHVGEGVGHIEVHELRTAASVGVGALRWVGAWALAAGGVGAWRAWRFHRHAGVLPRWATAAARWVPLAQATAAFALVAGLAGPWYALVWGRLLERQAHEAAGTATRGPQALGDVVRVLQDLVPAGLPLVPLGLIVALGAPGRRVDAVARAIGAAGATWLVIRWLPQDTRYLLPALPMAAGIVVAGAGRWPRAWGMPIALVACVLAWTTGTGPALGRDPAPVLAAHGSPLRLVAGPIHGIPVARLAAHARVPLPVLTVLRPEITLAGMKRVIDGLREACGARVPCPLRWYPPRGSGVAPRGVVALARLHGVDTTDASTTAGGDAVTGILQCGWTEALPEGTIDVGVSGCGVTFRSAP